MAEKRRVMLVDDEKLIVQGLQRALRPLHDTWEVVAATSGPEALSLLATRPADLVISDMRMPEMNGADLLEEVKRRSPGTVRIVLSGQAEDAAAFRVLPVAHRYFSKPTEAAALRAFVARVDTMRNTLPDASLQAALGALDSLPTPRAIRKELSDAFAAGADERDRKSVV